MRAEAIRFVTTRLDETEHATAALLRPAAPDFQTLLGRAAWMRLAPAVRARFETVDGRAHCAEYTGAMERVESSTVGLVLAQIYRLFGTPLAPHRGKNVPVDVSVYEADDASGVVWARTYRFEGKRPVTVRSTKVFNWEFGLLECIDGNLGMKLRIYEEGGALHFLSTGYFFRLGNRLIPLPLFLTPGVAHVVHKDEGAGCFRFTMSIDHPLLGQTFFQDGVFTERT